MLPTIPDISALRELFPESTPVIVFNEEGYLAADLSDHFDYLDLMKENYEVLVSGDDALLKSMIALVEELDLANTFEENYQFAILQCLGLLVGEGLATENENDIISLAEGCVADDGPGV